LNAGFGERTPAKLKSLQHDLVMILFMTELVLAEHCAIRRDFCNTMKLLDTYALIPIKKEGGLINLQATIGLLYYYIV
jgi:hypothetical protein